MPLGVEERAAVVACDDLGVGEPARARAADVRERSGWNVKDLPPGTKPAREVDVLEPELELLVPAADRLERVASDEQTGPRRLIHGDDGGLVQLQRRPRPSEQRAGECERAGKSTRQVLLLCPAVVGVDEPPRGGDGARPFLERLREQRDRTVGREHVVVEEEDELGGPGLGSAVVGERKPSGLLDADDLRAIAQRLGRPVDRTVVDHDHALEQRRPEVLDALEHELPRVAGRDDSVDHGGLIPSPAVSGLDAHLRSGPQMLQYHALADDLAARKPGRVLDWGCGYGQVSALLRERGIDVVPFDYRAGAPGTDRRTARALPGARGAPQPRSRRAPLRRRQLRHRAFMRRARACPAA